MRTAIKTKFLGPTNHRGARVKATASGYSATVAWDYALGVAGNHDYAARVLATQLGWHGTWFSGGTDEGCVYVLADAGSGDFLYIAEAAKVPA